jgi:hypothetical protein
MNPTPTITPTMNPTPTITPTMNPTPTITPTTPKSVFYVAPCCPGLPDEFMELPTSFVSLIGSLIVAGTNGNCYNVISQIVAIPTTTWDNGPIFDSCSKCYFTHPCPTPTPTPTTIPPTPTITPTMNPTPTMYPTPTRTPTRTPGTMYLAVSCCNSAIQKYVLLPSAGLGSRRVLISGVCYQTVAQANGTPFFIGTLLPISVTNCTQCTLLYPCPGPK